MFQEHAHWIAATASYRAQVLLVAWALVYFSLVISLTVLHVALEVLARTVHAQLLILVSRCRMGI
jgi:hypothetical protein